MDVYAKPYCREVYGECHEARYPYSNAFLSSRPIFPLLVFDGGAYFLIKELMGGADPYSRDLFKFIESGKLFEYWTAGGRFDWDLHYRLAQSSRLPISAERHVWINRLYFLLPIAQEFLTTGDEKWAREWIKWLESWCDSHPYQELDDRPHGQTDYVWRDMQVAWRLLVLLHSVKMLAASSALGEREWRIIYSTIELHADHLQREGQGHIARLGAHNHVLQIGLVLMMTGVLFEEMPGARSWRESGRKIIEINLERAILKDGGSVEGCPSYSHFIARMYLEALLLIEKNSLEPMEGLRDGVQEQYSWLRQMLPPTGKTLQIGDSYALDAAQDIEIVAELISLAPFALEGSALLPDSRFCALRAGDFEVYIDAMDRTQGHQHNGYAQIVAYYNGVPLLTDTGCCVYDRKDFREFYMSTRAHNALAIMDALTGEELTRGKDIRISTESFDPSVPSITFKISSDKFEWTRAVSIEGGELMISDHVTAPAPVNADAALHLAPTKAALISENQAAIFCGDGDIYVATSGDSGAPPLGMGVTPAMDGDNGFFYATELTYGGEGTEINMSVRIGPRPTAR